MDYLKKALRENDDLWPLPSANAAAQEALYAYAGAENVRFTLPEQAWDRAAQAAQASARKALLQTAEQTHTLALQMTRMERFQTREIVRRTEERGRSSGSFSQAAVQTVFSPEAQPMEEISRFFERDARRYGG